MLTREGCSAEMRCTYHLVAAMDAQTVRWMHVNPKTEKDWEA